MRRLPTCQRPSPAPLPKHARPCLQLSPQVLPKHALPCLQLSPLVLPKPALPCLQLSPFVLRKHALLYLLMPLRRLLFPHHALPLQCQGCPCLEPPRRILLVRALHPAQQPRHRSSCQAHALILSKLRRPHGLQSLEPLLHELYSSSGGLSWPLQLTLLCRCISESGTSKMVASFFLDLHDCRGACVL